MKKENHNQPKVSVVIRSMGRLQALAELLDCLLAQDHDNFEVVVVEQTQKPSKDDLLRLAPAFDDPRVRVLHHPPLGGPGARNEGVKNARGEIVILIDDDDLPIGTDWISAHQAHFSDPLLIGVTGRHVRTEGENSPYRPFDWYAKRKCMAYSWLIKVPSTFARLPMDKQPVDWLHGTNSSFRRDIALKAGLWDEHVRNQDEHSFAFKLARVKTKDQYLAFKEYPHVLRRMDIDGGMAKRYVNTQKELRNHLQFLHRIVGKYHQGRFKLLYPLYISHALRRTLNWVWSQALPQSNSFATKLSRSLEVLCILPTELKAERKARSSNYEQKPI